MNDSSSMWILKTEKKKWGGGMSTGSRDTIFLVVIRVFWLKLSIYGTFSSKEISEQLEVNETF